MNFSNDILNELEIIAPALVTIGRENVYSVPANYFENFNIKLSYQLLDNSSTTFSTPQDYFESFPQRILYKIREIDDYSNDSYEETKILDSLKGKNVFTVPNNYFENLKIPINNIKQPAVIKPIFKIQIWRQAAAAIITGIIAINALWIFNQSEDSNSTILKKDTYKSTVTQYKSEEQINEGISKLSNEDIVKYLTNNGLEVDNETLISNIGENDLPPQESGLSDEEAIKNYLNN